MDALTTTMLLPEPAWARRAASMTDARPAAGQDSALAARHVR
jgi:hypothetical protein